MLSSPAAMEFLTQALEAGASTAVIDLTRCEYLDSTFLGCLLTLHQQFNKGGAKRLRIAADAAKAKSLMGPSRLDRLLPLVAECPASVGERVPVASDEPMEKTAMAQHIMNCHRKLAEIEGPEQRKFAMIAEHMAKELAAQPRSV